MATHTIPSLHSASPAGIASLAVSRACPSQFLAGDSIFALSVKKTYSLHDLTTFNQIFRLAPSNAARDPRIRASSLWNYVKLFQGSVRIRANLQVKLFTQQILSSFSLSTKCTLYMTLPLESLLLAAPGPRHVCLFFQVTTNGTRGQLEWQG